MLWLLASPNTSPRWVDSSPTPAGHGLRVDVKDTIHRQTHIVDLGAAAVLQPGTHQWPFEFRLPGDTPESVEGMPEASITYRVRVTVDRGKLAHDMHAARHVRIIRTLQHNALELMHSMSVENTWPDKVDYSIVLARKSVLFGSVATLEMRLTPLLKGLVVGAITARMVEYRDCSLPGATTHTARSRRSQAEVAVWTWGGGGGSGGGDNEDNDDDMGRYWHDVIGDTGQEGWLITKTLPLPRTLGQCLQDLCHHGIKIRHKVKVTIALHNPDGHVSEVSGRRGRTSRELNTPFCEGWHLHTLTHPLTLQLRATLPISIHISPNTPIDPAGNLAPLALAAAATDLLPPPAYDERHLDMLYEGIDPAGFMTPLQSSGSATPFYALSRVGSSENLGLDGVLAAGGIAAGAVHPAELQRMLGRLPESSHSTTTTTPAHSEPSTATASSVSSPAWTAQPTPGSTPGSSPGAVTPNPASAANADPLAAAAAAQQQQQQQPLCPIHNAPRMGEIEPEARLAAELSPHTPLPNWPYVPQQSQSSGFFMTMGPMFGSAAAGGGEPGPLDLVKLPSYRTAVDGPPAYDSPAVAGEAGPSAGPSGSARPQATRSRGSGGHHHRPFGATVMQFLHRNSDEEQHHHQRE
jgi:hypothetical protein